MTTDPPRGGRPRVGDPTSGPRNASRQSFIRLAAGQNQYLQDVGDQLAVSGAFLLRRAVTRILDGTIRRPRSARTVPAPGDSSDARTVVLPADQITKLVALGEDVEQTKPGTLLHTPDQPRRGRPGNRDTQLRDALIRYAIDQDLAAERAALAGQEA